MPSLPLTKIQTLSNQIYPPISPGTTTTTTLPYTTQVGRTKLAIAEALVNCFAYGVSLAYANQTRDYQFSAFPGMHGQDVGYTFFNGDSAEGGLFGVPVDAATAGVMQRWFVDFAAYGGGGGSSGSGAAGQVVLPLYTAAANVVNVTGGGFAVVRDPAANARCEFWLRGLTS